MCAAEAFHLDSSARKPFSPQDPEHTEPEAQGYFAQGKPVGDFNKLWRKERELGRNPRGVADTISPEVYLPMLQQVREVADRLARTVERKEGGAALSYRVIDGAKISRELPNIYALAEEYRPYAESLYGEPLKILDGRLGVNINIVPVGGQQGLHLDRNPVTMVLYLNKFAGGELDIISGEKPSQIKAEAGVRAVLVGGDKIFHQVLPVREPGEGQDPERIAVVIGYGIPGKSYDNPALDSFIFGDDKEPKPH